MQYLLSFYRVAQVYSSNERVVTRLGINKVPQVTRFIVLPAKYNDFPVERGNL